MRHLLVALLVALLPLRGWIGDAMAIEMATHAVMQETAKLASATAKGAAPATGATVAPPDCHEAMAMTVTMTDNDAVDASVHASMAPMPGDAHADCGTCTACQMCHSAAFAAISLAPLLHTVPQATPAASAVQFASAEPSLVRKPPIS